MLRRHHVQGPEPYPGEAAPAGATFNLRSTLIDGEPWFVAIDVIRALHLTHDNVTIHTQKLRPDELQRVARSTLSPPKGGARMVMVSESGLYKLIMRSDKATSAPFQDWVTREVLPSIRKTGSYALAPGQSMPIPQEFLQVFLEATQAQTQLASLRPETRFRGLEAAYQPRQVGQGRGIVPRPHAAFSADR